MTVADITAAELARLIEGTMDQGTLAERLDKLLDSYDRTPKTLRGKVARAFRFAPRLGHDTCRFRRGNGDYGIVRDTELEAMCAVINEAGWRPPGAPAPAPTVAPEATAAPAGPWTAEAVLARLTSIAGRVPLNASDPESYRLALRLAFPACGEESIETWRATPGDGERHVLAVTRQTVGFYDSELNAIARTLNARREPRIDSFPEVAPARSEDTPVEPPAEVAAFAELQTTIVNAFYEAVARATEVSP